MIALNDNQRSPGSIKQLFHNTHQIKLPIQDPCKADVPIKTYGYNCMNLRLRKFLIHNWPQKPRNPKTKQYSGGNPKQGVERTKQIPSVKIG